MVGGMVGAGIFSLPRTFAGATGPIGALIAWLIAGTHSLHVEAFFCRQPDENHAAFYRFLLERSGRMYGVHFALDPVGDVYLVGRLPLAAIAPDEIDRLLGQADLLVTSGFGTGAGKLVQAMQAPGASSDDCALVLIWRS